MEREKNEKEVPNVCPENIKEEFYKWFESRGLLSDLRAYMRQLMVKALEESNKNGKICKHKRGSSSPKLQAINLLVVDYLFHEDYLYTVSVFASEAQILESLPQYSCYITQTVRERHWDPSSLPRFSAQETEDILDTLRLPPNQQDIKRASQLYLSGQESLLTCVVRTLASLNNQGMKYFRSDQCNVELNSEDHSLECNYQLWSQEMQDLLLMAGVKLQHIKRMQQKWAQIIEEEKNKSKKEVEEELLADRGEWEQKTEERIRCELSLNINKEQEQLNEQMTEMELREQGLTDLAGQLTTVHEDISERLSQLQLKNMELTEQEALQESSRLQLEERMSKVKVKEEYLENAINRFQAKQTNIVSQDENYGKSENFISCETSVETISRKEASVQVDINQSMISASTQTSDSGKTVYTQTLNTEDHEQQTSQSSQPDPELLLQLQMERQKLNELQEENLELRARALQQRTRIDELTNRAASLSTQLEESRVAVALLSGRENGVVVAQPTPPLIQPVAPAFITPTFGYNTPQRAGAGEESLFAPRPQQTPARPDGRRKPLRFAFSQNPSPTSEESSPTDEVIQNARVRIQQLEEESAAIQRSYQQFQTRLLTTDSVLFPPLNSPTVHRNPIIRVRRNDTVPGFSIREVPYPSNPLGMYAARISQRQFQNYNNNEDSSTDPSSVFYETARIEDMTNSRRMFSQRNIRQFERWKQFKKKFQRRDTLDFNRRTVSMANGNTSSDDDEIIKLHSRRMRKLNKDKKILRDEEGNSNFHHEKQNNKPSSGNKQPDNGNKGALDKTLNTFETPKYSNINEREENIYCSTSVANDFKIKEQESIKLIESVKTLLNDSNPVNSPSNTSSTLESWPKDHLSTKTVDDNNVIVHNTPHKDNWSRNENKSNSNCFQEHDNVMPSLQEVSIEMCGSYEETNQDQDNHAYENSNYIQYEPLANTNPRPISPHSTNNNEAIAEPEEGEKGTTSATSGSDILRELNTTKSDSSESVLSTGFVEGSKHSSDFWN